MAWVQWTAAARRPPHLVTLVTSGSPGRWFRDWPYRFGALWAEDYVEWVNRISGRSYQSPNLIDWNDLHQHRHPRSLDVTLGRPMPHWRECLDHTTLDDFWRRLEITSYDTIDLPALHVTGWFDACAPGELHHYREMVAASPAANDQALLLGAWGHGGACATGEVIAGEFDLGPEASIDMQAVWLAWFDRWLRGIEGESWPAVRYFTMGTNQWRETDAWPPSDAVARSLFLSSEGALSSEPPASCASVTFQYDPSDPTPGMERLSSDPLDDWSPRDLAFLERRSDVAVFTGEPAEEPWEIAGPVHTILHAASSAVDTDFAVVLADVDPTGRSIFISHGILRAPFRASLSDPTPLIPGERYELPIELADLGHVVLPGHRLRLTVTSCLFPYYHPNPNTGASYGDEGDGEYAIASQTLFTGPECPSRLVLFVRPARAAPAPCE
jgi:putative CocE/NonD family hydrolase